MIKKLIGVFKFSLCAILIFQLTGCGTLLYPERKGQKSGKIDAGVAILDGIGLLFFFVPGIIAYAVDFNNGTIYLPGTSRSSLDIQDLKQVKFDPKHSTMASIKRIIRNETGYDVNLHESNMQIVKLESSQDMLAHFAQVLPVTQNARVALSGK
ncbi:MAG: hypothetical protein P9M07_05635 [Candidatus Aceula meridiana]|nr:hypothetical protein [Candidatus Aceula meridiana]